MAMTQVSLRSTVCRWTAMCVISCSPNTFSLTPTKQTHKVEERIAPTKDVEMIILSQFACLFKHVCAVYSASVFPLTHTSTQRPHLPALCFPVQSNISRLSREWRSGFTSGRNADLLINNKTTPAGFIFIWFDYVLLQKEKEKHQFCVSIHRLYLCFVNWKKNPDSTRRFPM